MHVEKKAEAEHMSRGTETGIERGRRYESVVIVGSGVFGLTTALSLSLLPAEERPKSILVIDKSPFPAPDGSSIDISRIIRADYKDELYARLCARGQKHWRNGVGIWKGLGDDGRYNQSGLVLVANKDGIEKLLVDGMGGPTYVQKSMENVMKLEGPEVVIGMLYGKEEIAKVCDTGGASGDMGYLNKGSGWADAEEAMKFVKRRCEEVGGVDFLMGKVVGLVEQADGGGGGKVEGVKLWDGRVIKADVTVLATGAWTAGLIDLEGRAVSTGQVLGYVRVTAEEEKKYGKMPVILNLSTGLVVLPPRNGILKVARHAAGYVNPTSVIHGKNLPAVQTSMPLTSLSYPDLGIPEEAEADLRSALREMIPELGERPFFKTRLCWYTDTPTADFIVAHVPGREGLFVATGGSGHAFKFLPALGDEIVGILLERGGMEGVQEKWRWRERIGEKVITLDGSRGKGTQVELKTVLGEMSRVADAAYE